MNKRDTKPVHRIKPRRKKREDGASVRNPPHDMSRAPLLNERTMPPGAGMNPAIARQTLSLQATHGNAFTQQELKEVRAREQGAGRQERIRESADGARIHRDPKNEKGGQATYPGIDKMLENFNEEDKGRLPGIEKMFKKLSMTPEERAVWETRMLKNREDCWHTLSIVRDKLEKGMIAWRRTARELGRAYEQAYDTHKTAVEDAAKLKALKESIAFGVLTAATGGALGWIGEAMQAGTLGKGFQSMMAGGIEDMIQAGVGETIDVVQTSVAPSAQAVSKSPYRFESDLLDTIDDQWDKVLDYFIGKKEELDDSELEAFEGVNAALLRLLMTHWMAFNKMMKKPKEFDRKELAETLERGIWAAWVPGLVHKIKVERRLDPKDPPGAAGYEVRKLRSSPGSPVESRLNALGITEAAGIGKDFGWWTSDEEIDKLVSWANSYEPETFEF